jgi:branched-chain amino acid transport system ATP-binding protein
LVGGEPMALFEVEGLTAGYAQAPVIHEVSLRAETGELVAIIGPNGAGKSTLVKAVFGLADRLAGRVRLAGADVTGLRPNRLVALGLGYVPQVDNVFPSLTVRENLEMGAYRAPAEFRARLDEVVAMFPDLGAHLGRRAGDLSGGQRSMLALARALMMRPRVLLLDEPTAGLAPIYVDAVWSYVTRIADAGVAVVVVEQNARRALETCHRGIVLAGGRLVHEGTGGELLANEDVVRLYLGGAKAS